MVFVGGVLSGFALLAFGRSLSGARQIDVILSAKIQLGKLHVCVCVLITCHLHACNDVSFRVSTFLVRPSLISVVVIRRYWIP